jgi:putative hydrolase of the HAD superfamily
MGITMQPIEVIAFDADDTLWHNERLYAEAQATFYQLLSHYHSPPWVAERLYETEMRNLQHFGYGIKGFALSMIETAVELTEGRISGSDIQILIDLAKNMLNAQIEVFEHVAEVLARLAETYTLMVITKGDLRDQEQKVIRSGLAAYFRSIEIVSDKRQADYERLLQRHAIATARFMMVGNSLRSDILPILALGARAVYIPQDLTWAHESADPPVGQPGFYQLEHIGLLPDLLEHVSM